MQTKAGATGADVKEQQRSGRDVEEVGFAEPSGVRVVGQVGLKPNQDY